MEQPLNLSTEQVRQIDPEAFGRVWARVVADSESSPIALKAPPLPAERAPMQERETELAAAAQQLQVEGDSRPDTEPQESGQEDVLMQLVDMAAEGAQSVRLLAGRGGRAGPLLSGLAQEHGRALRQLEAACFLETGRRYQGRPRQPARSRGTAQALREQFLWERQWGTACARAVRHMQEPALQSLCRELAEDARLHEGIVRKALELTL